MKFLTTICILLCYTLPVWGQQEEPFLKLEPTTYPDRIMLTVPGSPATSRAVSWRTAYDNKVSIGEIAIAQPDSRMEARTERIYGTFSAWMEGDSTATGHKVVFNNLQPGTKYAYRVGDGVHWSEWIQFETSSDKAKETSFLYFGDIQNDIRIHASRVIRQAYRHFPNADFLLFAGDIVGKSIEKDWSDFFQTGGWIFSMVPSIAALGNHEYDSYKDRPRTFSKHWNQIYTMPANGPSEKYLNRFYYVDYQNVRIITVDAAAIQDNKEDVPLLLDWIDKALADNPSKWSVVVTHFPVFPCSYNRKTGTYHEELRKVLERRGADLVLQGHDHTYCRGRNLSAISSDCNNPPMYVVSIAGPKMYTLEPNFWSDREATRTQLYQHIAVSEGELHYQAFTVLGELYDEFKLVKNKKGRNRVTEPKGLSRIPVRMEIPNGDEKRYTEKELQKYRERARTK